MNVEVIDSHTGGEPTRGVVNGWPQPEGKTLSERVCFMKENQEHLRTGAICEPRGHNAIVGALLTPPENPESLTGVIFFNDVGYIGMCGHAMIGTVETLRHLGKLNSHKALIDTPVGTVSIEIGDDGNVTVANVPSYLYMGDAEVYVEGLGQVRGDVAWGGNWFFLVNNQGPELTMSNIDFLMSSTKKIRQALIDSGITGEDGAVVDHIEFFGDPVHPDAHSKNFVLCPGNAYDRAPCGTGTSAKLACLYAKGKLQVGQEWIQESITGSLYKCWLEDIDGVITPFVTSRAHITAESTQYFSEEDDFCWGIE